MKLLGLTEDPTMSLDASSEPTHHIQEWIPNPNTGYAFRHALALTFRPYWRTSQNGPS
jgi:hypothetical protein